MKSQRFLSVFIFVVFATIISGCAPRYANLMRQKGQNEGWTKEQQAVAEHLSYRLKFTKENLDGTFSVNYCVLPNELVAKIVKARIDDLGEVLDYKNPDWAPYIKAFGLRGELEREEKVFKANYNRLRLIDNHNKFRQLMGQISSSRPMETDLCYDASRVFVEDVFATFPFTSDRIEEARKSGKLNEVERILWSAKRAFGRKDQDPSDPDDPNKFVWRAEEIGIEFVSYKILDDPNPRDNNLDYVEGTRFTMTSNGMRRESRPALRLFVPDRSWPAVLVIDKDKEGEVGFALPDSVETVSATLTTAESLFNTPEIVNSLFPVSLQERRVQPKDPPPVIVDIAPVGRNRIEVWEYNDQGWTVPFRYKNDRADNYYVSVKIKGDENAHFDPSAINKQIEYLKKQWNGGGNVVEYFRSKPPFDQANLVNISVGGNRVVVVTNQGEEITGYVTSGSNRVIQDRPYQVEYTESEKRWLLADEDNDGKFEKRKQVAR